MRRVLVTGATGFVGGRVTRRLREAGDEVRAVVRQPSEALTALGVEQREGGLDAVDATAFDGIDGVVHAAASTGPRLGDARRVNRDGTRRLVDAALAGGLPRFVHVSTTSVYDRDAADPHRLDEDAPRLAAPPDAPNSATDLDAYGVTKAEAEAEVEVGIARGLGAVVLRPPAVLGAGPTSTWGTRVPRRLLEGAFPPRPLTASFAWVHIDDLVDAVVAALDTEVVATLNVVGGHTTLGDYLRAIAELLPQEVTLPEPPAGDAGWQGRFLAERQPDRLGVRPARTFEAAMSEIQASWRYGDPEHVPGEPPVIGRRRVVPDARLRSSRRIVPRSLSDEQRERLRFLLDEPDTWVLRPGWESFLLSGDHATLVRTDELNADHRAAALAWLRQQRHALYRELEGGEIAPDGWLEDLPLVTRLLELAPSDTPEVAER